MAEQELIPAAQYLRMSTEYQQYSIENQQAAIHEYALLNGFTIVQTYADPARSGVVLRGRTALIRLLEDVVRRRANYKAILVYDISRWGRFQDNDEAAYYEFLCKNCGIPIHYCVEPFRNDTSLPNMILKALKRAMAGEFSREHGRRTYQAQKQMVERGYKVGAPPGYGLRRMLVNADKSRNRILAAGEYKGISTDRIILVPGPAEELKTVRQIYGTYIHTNGWAGPKLIADELNRQGVPFVDGKRWDFNAVRGVLTNPKYAGWNVWGRTSQKLKTQQLHLPTEQWVMVPNAFEPIIDQRTFDRAQVIRRYRLKGMTESELKAVLCAILKRKGRLTKKIIERSRLTRSVSYYWDHYGGLQQIYALAGYKPSVDVFSRRASGVRTEDIMVEVAKAVGRAFPDHVTVMRANSRTRRPVLLVDGQFTVSVFPGRSYRTEFGTTGITVKPLHQRSGELILLFIMSSDRRRVESLFITPPLDTECWQYKFDEDDPWFNSGTRLRTLSEFYRAVTTMYRQHRNEGGSLLHPRDLKCLLQHPFGTRRKVSRVETGGIW